MIQEKKKRDGSSSYRAKVYINGRQVTKTFRRKADAKLWIQQHIVDRERGVLNLINQTATKSLNEFSQEWFTTKVSGKSPKTMSAYQIQLQRHILPVIGEIKLKDLRITHGHQVLAKLRAKGRSPKGINMTLGVLKGILNDAVRWEILNVSPFRNLTLEKVPPRSAKFWMPEDIKKFLSANRHDDLYELWVVALNTGMRRGELAGLKWDKVDFKNKLIHVARVRDRSGLRETTKTSSSFRYVPMNAAAEEALKVLDLEQRHDEFVFAYKTGDLIDPQHLSERGFKKAMIRAGVPFIRLHDLRTTFASNVCMAPNGDLFGLSKILGHSSVDMTVKRYAHLHNNFLKQVACSVDFRGEA